MPRRADCTTPPPPPPSAPAPGALPFVCPEPVVLPSVQVLALLHARMSHLAVNAPKLTYGLEFENQLCLRNKRVVLLGDSQVGQACPLGQRENLCQGSHDCST